MSTFYQDILSGNAQGFQKGLTQFLQETISFYDNAEAFYHGFILGILSGLKTHIVKSNQESGDGRLDIFIRSLDIQQPLIIIELKTAESYRSLDVKAKEALEQIEKLSYDREFAQEGYQRSIRYGIAFYKKLSVKKEELNL